MGRLIGLVLLAAASMAGAADAQFGVSVGQATDSQDTDVMRLTYRRALSSDPQPWWRPQQVLRTSVA